MVEIWSAPAPPAVPAIGPVAWVSLSLALVLSGYWASCRRRACRANAV